MSTPILLDCDPGHDDAIALLLALGSDELELRGVTTVAGNQTLEKTTANAIRVLELAGGGQSPGAPGGPRPTGRGRPRRDPGPRGRGPPARTRGAGVRRRPRRDRARRPRPAAAAGQARSRA